MTSGWRKLSWEPAGFYSCINAHWHLQGDAEQSSQTFKCSLVFVWRGISLWTRVQLLTMICIIPCRPATVSFTLTVGLTGVRAFMVCINDINDKSNQLQRLQGSSCWRNKKTPKSTSWMPNAFVTLWQSCFHFKCVNKFHCWASEKEALCETVRSRQTALM